MCKKVYLLNKCWQTIILSETRQNVFVILFIFSFTHLYSHSSLAILQAHSSISRFLPPLLLAILPSFFITSLITHHHSVVSLYGGVGLHAQCSALTDAVDIVIATPVCFGGFFMFFYALVYNCVCHFFNYLSLLEMMYTHRWYSCHLHQTSVALCFCSFCSLCAFTIFWDLLFMFVLCIFLFYNYIFLDL